MADPTASVPVGAASAFDKAKQAANDLRDDAVDKLHDAQDALKKGVETGRETLHETASCSKRSR